MNTNIVSVEKEYEETITLYLENGYMIVSQTDNSTILVSPNLQKKSRSKATVAAILTQGDIIASSTASANNNITQFSKYQVLIRITKIGELQVTGYTLDKHEAEKNASSNGQIVALCIVMILIAIMLYFL